MLALASSHAPSLFTIISAVSSTASGLILAILAWRAQSAKQQLEEFNKLLREAGDRITDDVKQALKESLGTHPQSRRWYDR